MSNSDEPVTREIVLDARLVAAKSVSRVEVRRIRMQPGVAGGLHIHNSPVFGNIVSGSVTYQIEGDAASVLGPGEVFHEPEGARIARFDAGEEGVEFLGYFLLESGQNAEIDFPDA